MSAVGNTRLKLTRIFSFLSWYYPPIRRISWRHKSLTELYKYQIYIFMTDPNTSFMRNPTSSSPNSPLSIQT